MQEAGHLIFLAKVTKEITLITHIGYFIDNLHTFSRNMMLGKKIATVKKEICMNDFDWTNYLQFYNDGNINMF